MTSSPSPADLPDMVSLVPPHRRPQDALPLTGGLSQRPRPLAGLVASAQRLTTRTISGGANRPGKASEWQADAWDMYDLVGEQRFLTNTLAGRASQARLYVGRLPSDDPLAEPEPLDDPVLQGMLDSIGKAATGRAQLVLRMVMNYFIAGEGYLVGFPPQILAKARGEVDPTPLQRGEVLMTDLEWRVLSVAELKYKTETTVEVMLAETGGKKFEVKIDDLYVIRSWRPHPQKAWQADSPTRSSLPVLRELVGLTMSIGASVDSRLAGAGVFIVPDSARKAMLRAMGESEDSAEDPLADALIDAMSAAIQDRSSAASFTPLVLTVPDASEPHFRHITFDKNFDKEMRPLREEAIRRVALGQDAPPELLLGVGGMNHWGAWLVREDVVTTHLEPPLALFCDSITTQFLRPLMQLLGYTPEQIDDTVVWYDVSHMIVRPNRGTDAQAIYDKGELSGEALRRENGFDENDAPPVLGQADPAVDLALQLIAQAPSLMQAPGLPAIVEQIRLVQDGDTSAAAENVAAGGTGEEADEEAVAADAAEAESAEAESSGDGPPATSDEPADPPAVTASAVRGARRDGAVTESAIAGRLEEQADDEEGAE